MDLAHISLVLMAWMIAGGSPGPATLAISATSMEQGRAEGLTIAAGIVVGSASWGIAAAFGMSAVMMANVWLFEVVRYLGAAYLLFLAVKSLLRTYKGSNGQLPRGPRGKLFSKGLLLHLTNPKAILSWGSVYAIALPAGASNVLVFELFAILICGSMIVFFGYALLFSAASVTRSYRRMQRWFDLAFATLFGAASLKILTARAGG